MGSVSDSCSSVFSETVITNKQTERVFTNECMTHDHFLSADGPWQCSGKRKDDEERYKD